MGNPRALVRIKFPNSIKIVRKLAARRFISYFLIFLSACRAQRVTISQAGDKGGV